MRKSASKPMTSAHCSQASGLEGSFAGVGRSIVPGPVSTAFSSITSTASPVSRASTRAVYPRIEGW